MYPVGSKSIELKWILIRRSSLLVKAFGVGYGIAAILLVARISEAVLVEFTIDHAPILLGQTVRFTATDDGAAPVLNPLNCNWFYACLSAGCQGNYIGGDIGNPIDYVERSVGKQNVKCIQGRPEADPIDGGPPPPPPPGAPTVVHSIEVFGPNADTIAGLNTPADKDARIPITVTLTYNGTPIGTNFSGYMQEYIVDQQDGKVYDWFPDTASTSGNFSLVGNQLIDKQGQQFTDATWAAIPVNTIYTTVQITYRLVTNDCCGQQQVFPLTPHTFKRRKLPNNMWQIEGN